MTLGRLLGFWTLLGAALGLLGCLATLAVTLGLVHQLIGEYWAVAVMPATCTVAAIVATAWVCDWLDS